MIIQMFRLWTVASIMKRRPLSAYIAQWDNTGHVKYEYMMLDYKVHTLFIEKVLYVSVSWSGA